MDVLARVSFKLPNPVEEGEGSDIASIINLGLELGDGAEQQTVYNASALWIGVGANSAMEQGSTLRAKESAIESIRDKDYNNLAFNDRIAYNITFNASGVPLTSTMLYDMSKLLKPDWRILGLRVALWDSLREVTTTDPTGVQWAAAINQDHLKFRINTDEVEAWGFQAAFVSLHYIENSVHQSAGGIPVGPAGDMGEGETWMIQDPRVKVVVLEREDRRYGDRVGTVDACSPKVSVKLGLGGGGD